MVKDIDNSQKRKHVIIKRMGKCSLPLALIVCISAYYQEREGCCPRAWNSNSLIETVGGVDETENVPC